MDCLLILFFFVVVPGREAPKTQNSSAHLSSLLDRHTPFAHAASNGFHGRIGRWVGAFVHARPIGSHGPKD